MFTEVKEMIDSTIYENGKGEVTAQNVNLAMHGIVDAAEETVSTLDGKLTTETNNREALEERVTAIEENGTGGGSQPIVVYMGIVEETEEGEVCSLTPEEKAHNAEAYKAIKESRGHGNIVIDMTRRRRQMAEAGPIESIEFIDTFDTFCVMSCIYEHGIVEGEEMEALLFMTLGAEWYFLPDGSISEL